MKAMAIPNTPPPAGNPNYGRTVVKALFFGLVFFVKAVIWLARVLVALWRRTRSQEGSIETGSQPVLQLPDPRAFAGAETIVSVPLEPPVAVIRLRLHQVENHGVLKWNAQRILSIQEEGLARRLGGRLLSLGTVDYDSSKEDSIKAQSVSDAQALINRDKG